MLSIFSLSETKSSKIASNTERTSPDFLGFTASFLEEESCECYLSDQGQTCVKRASTPDAHPTAPPLLRSIPEERAGMEGFQRELDNLNSNFLGLTEQFDRSLSGVTDNLNSVTRKIESASSPDLTIDPFSTESDSIDFSSLLEDYNLVCGARLLDDEQRRLRLPAYLKDRAREVYNGLSSSQKAQYSSLCAALESQLKLPEMAIYFETAVHNRQQKEGDSLASFLNAIKKGCKLAFAGESAAAINRLILSKFFGGVRPTDLQFQVFKEMHKTVFEAEQLARKLDMQNLLFTRTAISSCDLPTSSPDMGRNTKRFQMSPMDDQPELLADILQKLRMVI